MDRIEVKEEREQEKKGKQYVTGVIYGGIVNKSELYGQKQYEIIT